MSNRAIIEANKEYREFGYIIYPNIKEHVHDSVTYPMETILELPCGSQISGAKSQNDASKFDTFDDIIRIYALVPTEFKHKHNYAIYVFPTGGIIKIPYQATKVTIVKEGRGEAIYHIYVAELLDSFEEMCYHK